MSEAQRRTPRNQPLIGARIRHAMELKGWDQKRLAREMGVSRSAVNMWMNDRAYPRNAIARLERLLDVSLPREYDEPGSILSPGALNLLRREMDPGDYELVIEILERVEAEKQARAGSSRPGRRSA